MRVRAGPAERNLPGSDNAIRDGCCSTLIAEMQASGADVDTTTEAMLVALRALVAVAARSLADSDDVTVPQFRALVVLMGPEPLTVGHLAEALDLQPSTATRLCDRLVRKRLIRRIPRASGDRRETTLVLTARGRRLVERVTERRRRDIAAIAARMSASDRRSARQGLWAVAAAAGEVSAPATLAWLDDPPRPEAEGEGSDAPTP